MKVFRKTRSTQGYSYGEIKGMMHDLIFPKKQRIPRKLKKKYKKMGIWMSYEEAKELHTYIMTVPDHLLFEDSILLF